MLRPILLMSAVMFMAMGVAAKADSAKPLGRFDDWEGFTYSDKAGKVCYVASLPKRSLNAPKGRKETYVSITHRPKDNSIGVVSVTLGVPLKKDAPAEVDVSGDKFELFTEGDTAWSRNDKAVVASMMKGRSLVVHSTPAKGDAITDTYSLTGFAKAYTEISKACGVK